MEVQVPSIHRDCHKQFAFINGCFYANRTQRYLQAIYALHSYYYYNDGEHSHYGERA